MVGTIFVVKDPFGGEKNSTMHMVVVETLDNFMVRAKEDHGGVLMDHVIEDHSEYSLY